LKEKKLGKISVFELNEKLLLAIDKKWSKFFRTTKPKFYAKIDKNNRYVLLGPVVTTDPKVNCQFPKEVTENN